MYATPAKYPTAPASYPAPTTYPVPTTTYPAPAKYEAVPKYEEKKEEYPMKPEYKKETYPVKMEYGGKKYRRSADDKQTEEIQEDSVKVAKKAEVKRAEVKLSEKNIKLLRDAVIENLLSDPQWSRRRGFGRRGYYGRRRGYYGRRRGYYDGDGLLNNVGAGLIDNIGGDGLLGDPFDSLSGIRALNFDDEDDSDLMVRDDHQFLDME
jgi:hypothetical protein